jgi:hypothetical protein
VWSEVVQACRKGRSTTAHEIAENTGMSNNTVLSAVDNLVVDGLATRVNRRILAVEPPMQSEWFVRKKSKNGNWANEIAYFVVEFYPELSLLQNILLGRLKSLPQLHHQSYVGLAKMLGVKNRTDIRRALEGGEYKRRPRKKNAAGTWVTDTDGEIVSRTTDGLLQHRYIDAVGHRDDGYLQISLNPFVCPADDVDEYREFAGALNGSLKAVVGAMKHEGFTEHLIDQILRTLSGQSIYRSKFAGYNEHFRFTAFINEFKAARSTHAQSQAEGRFRQHGNCGVLLKARLDQVAMRGTHYPNGSL